LLFFVYLFHRAVEVVERSVDDLDGFADDIRFCVTDALFADLVHLAEHLVDFGFTEGGGVILSEEMDHAGDTFDGLDDIIAELAIGSFEQEIPGEKDFFAQYFFTTLHLEDFLNGAKNLQYGVSPSADLDLLV